MHTSTSRMISMINYFNIARHQCGHTGVEQVYNGGVHTYVANTADYGHTNMDFSQN